MHFPSFFSKKVKKKKKKPPNLTKIGCIRDPNFIYFIFGDGSVAEGNTTIFWALNHATFMTLFGDMFHIISHDPKVLQK